tara:strand:+ start:69 stop:404 length:336 start_codon:yes stop_codon:yes gene_type:complete
LSLINLKKGFSLLEVVIALLIISITFLAYSQLIEQNLKAQELKKRFIEDYQLRTNVLTVYVANAKINDSQVLQFFDLDSISHTQVSRYNSLVELEIEFQDGINEYSIKIVK